MANGKSPNDITPIGYHNFRGNSGQKFGIKMDDRRRHIYVVGKTGVGKSTLLENMAIADIEAGKRHRVHRPARRVRGKIARLRSGRAAGRRDLFRSVGHGISDRVQSDGAGGQRVPPPRRVGHHGRVQEDLGGRVVRAHGIYFEQHPARAARTSRLDAAWAF